MEGKGCIDCFHNEYQSYNEYPCDSCYRLLEKMLITDEFEQSDFYSWKKSENYYMGEGGPDGCETCKHKWLWNDYPCDHCIYWEDRVILRVSGMMNDTDYADCVLVVSSSTSEASYLPTPKETIK